MPLRRRRHHRWPGMERPLCKGRGAHRPRGRRLPRPIHHQTIEVHRRRLHQRHASLRLPLRPRTRRPSRLRQSQSVGINRFPTRNRVHPLLRGEPLRSPYRFTGDKTLPSRNTQRLGTIIPPILSIHAIHTSNPRNQRSLIPRRKTTINIHHRYARGTRIQHRQHPRKTLQTSPEPITRRHRDHRRIPPNRPQHSAGHHPYPATTTITRARRNASSCANSR